ncbi:MAG: inositol monophosphatase family protein [Solirubrobacteraceae bacterium]
MLGRDVEERPARSTPRAVSSSGGTRPRPPGRAVARIRPARWEDRLAIAELIEAMGEHTGAVHRDGTTTAIAATLELPTARMLVAEDDRGAVVGHVELHSRPGTLHGRREAWIAALSVLPGARGAGIGGRLLDGARQEAALLGCDELVLESSMVRSEAHRFYRDRGFRDASPAVRLRAPVAALTGESLQERFLFAAAQAATAVAAALPSRAERMPAAGGFDTADKFVDLEAERLALAFLVPLGIPIISEESGVIGAAPAPGETWLSLDPLDGTRNCMHGLAPWALSAGLVCDGRAVAGFVADLSSGRRWWAGSGGAHVDGRPLRPRSGGILILPSCPPNDLPALRYCDGFERVRLVGSTAIDLCRVADGTCGAFCDLTRAVARVHDLAGAMAVLHAAGATLLAGDGEVPLLVGDPKVRFHVVAAATECEARMLLENAVAPSEAGRLT